MMRMKRTISVVVSILLLITALPLSKVSTNPSAMALFDANFNKVQYANIEHLQNNTMTYFFNCVPTDDGFEVTIKEPTTVAYVAFTFARNTINDGSYIAIDEDIGFKYVGTLATDIKTLPQSIEGLDDYVNRLIDAKLK